MKNLTIYTDGSHLKHTTGRLGIGGVLVDNDTNKKIDEFSQELSIDFLKNNYGTSDVSNPTCEMLAALISLRIFKTQIENCNSLCIKADYAGVREFNLGNWHAKAPYIQKIKIETDKEINSIGLRGKISFGWVKGHQNKSILDKDGIWNSYVDILAKGKKP